MVPNRHRCRRSIGLFDVGNDDGNVVLPAPVSWEKSWPLHSSRSQRRRLGQPITTSMVEHQSATIMLVFHCSCKRLQTPPAIPPSLWKGTQPPSLPNNPLFPCLTHQKHTTPTSHPIPTSHLILLPRPIYGCLSMTGVSDMSATPLISHHTIATLNAVAVESTKSLMTRTPVHATIMRGSDVINIIINQIMTADAHIRSNCGD